jgi:hypothetical protein
LGSKKFGKNYFLLFSTFFCLALIVIIFVNLAFNSLPETQHPSPSAFVTLDEEIREKIERMSLLRAKEESDCYVIYQPRPEMEELKADVNDEIEVENLELSTLSESSSAASKRHVQSGAGGGSSGTGRVLPEEERSSSKKSGQPPLKTSSKKSRFVFSDESSVPSSEGAARRPTPPPPKKTTKTTTKRRRKSSGAIFSVAASQEPCVFPSDESALIPMISFSLVVSIPTAVVTFGHANRYIFNLTMVNLYSSIVRFRFRFQ